MKKNKTYESLFIRTRNLTKKYLIGKDSIVALNKLNITFKKGLNLVYGPNGSGKSTLFNCLLGIEFFEEGEVIFSENKFGVNDVKELKKFVKKNVGRVFSHDDLVEFITVKDNILLRLNALENLGKLSNFDNLLELLKLIQFKNAIIREIPYYYRVLTSIARELAFNPKYFLLDEPDVNLHTNDKINLIEVLRYFADLNDILIIYFTSSSDMCIKYNKLVKIDSGKIS